MGDSIGERVSLMIQQQTSIDVSAKVIHYKVILNQQLGQVRILLCFVGTYIANLSVTVYIHDSSCSS